MLNGYAYSRAVRAHILAGIILDEVDLTGKERAETENKLRESERSLILFVKENRTYQSLRAKFKTSLHNLEDLRQPSTVSKCLARHFTFGRFRVLTPVPPNQVWVFFRGFPTPSHRCISHITDKANAGSVPTTFLPHPPTPYPPRIFPSMWLKRLWKASAAPPSPFIHLQICRTGRPGRHIYASFLHRYPRYMWSSVILLEEGSFVAICKRNCYRLQNFLDVSLCSHGVLDEYQRRSTSVTHRAPNHNASSASYVAHHKKLKITPSTTSSPNPLPTVTITEDQDEQIPEINEFLFWQTPDDLDDDDNDPEEQEETSQEEFPNS
ncbi:hypothetical protein GEV33_014316 [Tenebrio molitor]|uniref:Uncharacterized protein n=1 Tax=Tenebrio molitor TaxID=7067 RepID=A0A8J6L4W0_TENMO|nr:hypothetical protein GEV33_014316 [Tenebrio molitor]